MSANSWARWPPEIPETGVLQQVMKVVVVWKPQVWETTLWETDRAKRCQLPQVKLWAVMDAPVSMDVLAPARWTVKPAGAENVWPLRAVMAVAQAESDARLQVDRVDEGEDDVVAGSHLLLKPLHAAHLIHLAAGSPLLLKPRCGVP